jgi:hypothetical protein
MRDGLGETEQEAARDRRIQRSLHDLDAFVRHEFTGREREAKRRAVGAVCLLHVEEQWSPESGRDGRSGRNDVVRGRSASRQGSIRGWIGAAFELDHGTECVAEGVLDDQMRRVEHERVATRKIIAPKSDGMIGVGIGQAEVVGRLNMSADGRRVARAVLFERIGGRRGGCGLSRHGLRGALSSRRSSCLCGFGGRSSFGGRRRRGCGRRLGGRGRGRGRRRRSGRRRRGRWVLCPGHAG